MCDDRGGGGGGERGAAWEVGSVSRRAGRHRMDAVALLPSPEEPRRPQPRLGFVCFDVATHAQQRFAVQGLRGRRRLGGGDWEGRQCGSSGNDCKTQPVRLLPSNRSFFEAGAGHAWGKRGDTGTALCHSTAAAACLPGLSRFGCSCYSTAPPRPALPLPLPLGRAAQRGPPPPPRHC